MHFERFPPEIRANIIRCLGRPFFKKDVSRLSISKSWYHDARRVLHSEVRLTPASLVMLSAKRTSLEGAVKFAKTVHLSLVEDRVMYKKVCQQRDWEDGIMITLLQQCGLDTRGLTKDIDDSIKDLITVLEKFDLVKYLRLTARERSRKYTDDSRHDISVNTIDSLVSVSANLASLHFDMIDYTPRYENADSLWHPCKKINALFPLLQRLWFRADTVCSDLLDVQHFTSVALKDVIVVLNIPTSEREYRGYCNDENFEHLDTLQSTIRLQAALLVPKAQQATRIRVVTCHPNGPMYSFDALTGTRTRLEKSSKLIWNRFQGTGVVLDDKDLSDQRGFRDHIADDPSDSSDAGSDSETSTSEESSSEEESSEEEE